MENFPISQNIMHYQLDILSYSFLWETGIITQLFKKLENSERGVDMVIFVRK